jgi:tetratricopeptide (TPR) repeat protein
MKSIILNPPSNQSICIFLFTVLFGVSFAHAQNYGEANKMTIIKMFNGDRPEASAVLTINEPCGYPATPNCGKPIKGVYNYNPRQQYNSGTTFMTHDNYTVFIKANGSISKVSPNSSTMIKMDNKGNESHTPKGVVGIVAEKTRDLSKSIIINGRNVSAKMKTTEFWVDTRGEQTKFSPVEGTISIIEKVPVTIGGNVFKDESENREHARSSTYPVRTERSAGQEPYSTGQQASKNYDSVTEAINQIADYVNNFGNTMDSEELAETYVLLGEFYLNTMNYDNAKIAFDNAANIYTDIDPLGMNAMEAELYLSEAEIFSNDPNAVSGVKKLIQELLENLNYNLEEYNYAGQIGAYDIQNDYCYELVNTNDLLGWAYDLIDDEVAADEYYGYAESYPCQD